MRRDSKRNLTAAAATFGWRLMKRVSLIIIAATTK